MISLSPPPAAGFNSRLREEATTASRRSKTTSTSFNSRLREEATRLDSPHQSHCSRFNSRLREEATLFINDSKNSA